jgi:FixJ family two-component response regulator
MTSAARRVVQVAEDDDSMREACGRLLGAAGFECQAFSSAEALLAHGGTQRNVTCVVSDLRLPGQSGLELLDALRARGRTEPFVLITAHDAPGLRDEALRRGAAAYLAKPFRGTLLVDTIESVDGRPAQT